MQFKDINNWIGLITATSVKVACYSRPTYSANMHSDLGLQSLEI